MALQQEFVNNLNFGQVGESTTAMWLRSRGWNVMPAYELLMYTGKGPRIFGPDNSQIIAPDMLIFKANNAVWIEAKNKTAFTWHRITNRWVTGIDFRHYHDYCIVDDISPWPVHLMFIQNGGQAKDSPPKSPSGLYGRTLKFLRRHENHRYPQSPPHKMVYWAEGILKLHARMDELAQCHASEP